MKRMYVAAMVQPRMRPDEGNLNYELAPSWVIIMCLVTWIEQYPQLVVHYS